MASKGASTVSAARFVRHESAISIGSDSGSEIAADRRQEFEAVIREGSNGATGLAGPSLMADVGTVMVSVEEGDLVLYNGKHLVAALRNVQREIKAMTEKEREQQHWFDTVLREACWCMVWSSPCTKTRTATAA